MWKYGIWVWWVRKLRRRTGFSTIADVKSAYIQLDVTRKLWKYQLVQFKEKTYCLTRLRFGPNVAPNFMASILKTLLEKMDGMSWIPILMIFCWTRQQCPFKCFPTSLGSLASESLKGGSVWGLWLHKDMTGDLECNGNEIPGVGRYIIKCELFSICGRLIGHCPIAGWHRTTCSYIKWTADWTGKRKWIVRHLLW